MLIIGGMESDNFKTFFQQQLKSFQSQKLFEDNQDSTSNRQDSLLKKNQQTQIRYKSRDVTQNSTQKTNSPNIQYQQKNLFQNTQPKIKPKKFQEKSLDYNVNNFNLSPIRKINFQNSQKNIIQTKSITDNREENIHQSEQKIVEDFQKDLQILQKGTLLTQNSEQLEDYQQIPSNRFTLKPKESFRREYSPETINDNINENTFSQPQQKNENSDIIQLMKIDNNGKIILFEKTLQKIEQIQDYISILSIIGPYRSGKSFLLNRFQNQQKGFDLGSTTNPCTQGVWVWGTNKISNHENNTTLLIDTEGLFAYNRDEQTDMLLFLFTCLISSLMIYNTFGVINEDAIERLSFLTEVGKYFGILEKKNYLTEQNLSDYFPKFIWLLRDFSLELKSNEDKEMTPDEYLEYTLMKKQQNYNNPIIEDIHQSYVADQTLLNKSTHREVQKNSFDQKNLVRQKIKQIFKNRSCFTLPRPVNDEKQLRNIQDLKYQQLRDKFKIDLEHLILYVQRELTCKIYKNNKMKGSEFVQYIRIITNAINEGKIPKMYSIWERMLLFKKKQILNKFSLKINSVKNLLMNNLQENNLTQKQWQQQIEQQNNDIIMQFLQEDIEKEEQIEIYQKIQKDIKILQQEMEQQFQEKKLENQKIQFDTYYQQILQQMDEKKDFINQIYKLQELTENFINKINDDPKDFEQKLITNKIFQTFIKAIEKLIKLNEQKLSQLEIQKSKLEGKVEAQRNLLENQKKMMDNVMQEQKQIQIQSKNDFEQKLKDIKESYQSKIAENSLMIEKQQIQTQLQKKFSKQENQDNIENELFEIKELVKNLSGQIVQQQTQLTTQKSSQNNLNEKQDFIKELETVRKQNQIDNENTKNYYKNKIQELKDKNNDYQSFMEELKMVLLKKESEIKILQEKLIHEQKYKSSQMEFSSMLCNISDQVMHLLQKMERKINQIIIKQFSKIFFKEQQCQKQVNFQILIKNLNILCLKFFLKMKFLKIIKFLMKNTLIILSNQFKHLKNRIMFYNFLRLKISLNILFYFKVKMKSYLMIQQNNHYYIKINLQKILKLQNIC